MPQSVTELNDHLRTTLKGGTIMITQGVEALGELGAVLAKVRSYNNFSEDNDPWYEHDFGSFEHLDAKIFWKIDYYKKGNMGLGSPDPSDPQVTERVLTILLAEEY